MYIYRIVVFSIEFLRLKYIYILVGVVAEGVGNHSNNFVVTVKKRLFAVGC